MATTKRTGGAARKRAGTSATKRAGARKAPAKGTRKAAAKGARKAAAKGAGRYTDAALRERLKRRIMAGSKGGSPGQWSARKAQLLAHEYKAKGGGYRGGRSEGQRHLGAWTKEEWTTADGRPARRGKTTARYLPKKAWSELTPAERRATDSKKRAASKGGRQFVANTKRAAAARKGAAKRPAAKRSATRRPTKRASKRASKRATKRA